MPATSDRALEHDNVVTHHAWAPAMHNFERPNHEAGEE